MPAAAPKTILSFGETLWDLLPSGRVLGGAPFNLACRAHLLGDRGLIVTRLGPDPLGADALEGIAGLGMDTAFVQRDADHATGTVEVTLDSGGSPDFHILPDVAYDHIDPASELLDLVGKADCFCFGTLIQRSPGSRRTLQRLLEVRGARLRFLDLNLRKHCFTEASVRFSLGCADLVKLNGDEAGYLAGLFQFPSSSPPEFCAEILRRWKLQACIITLGEWGAFAANHSGGCVYVPGYSVPVVDTCGSGDAFSAGFLHEHLRGRPLAECCRLGCALGALVATQRGATQPISPLDIESFLHGQPKTRTDASLRSFIPS